jgi:hypothetical protein
MTGKPPSQARHIIDDVLGGRQRAHDITGEPLTRIDSMLRTGWIPQPLHQHFLESAWAAGVKINQLDFVVHLAGLVPPARQPERSSA